MPSSSSCSFLKRETFPKRDLPHPYTLLRKHTCPTTLTRGGRVPSLGNNLTLVTRSVYFWIMRGSILRLLGRLPKSLCIIIFLPYIILAIGAEGLHLLTYEHPYPQALNASSSEGIPEGPQLRSPYYHSHDEDNCVMCQWIKHLPQLIQSSGPTSSILPTSYSKFFCPTAIKSFPAYERNPRAPPV